MVLREPACVVLVPDILPVDVDVEHAAGPLDQRRIDTEFCLDRLRQTGGLGQVASLAAVSDGYVHAGARYVHADAPPARMSRKKQLSPFNSGKL